MRAAAPSLSREKLRAKTETIMFLRTQQSELIMRMRTFLQTLRGSFPGPFRILS